MRGEHMVEVGRERKMKRMYLLTFMRRVGHRDGAERCAQQYATDRASHRGEGRVRRCARVGSKTFDSTKGYPGEVS